MGLGDERWDDVEEVAPGAPVCACFAV